MKPLDSDEDEELGAYQKKLRGNYSSGCFCLYQASYRSAMPGWFVQASAKLGKISHFCSHNDLIVYVICNEMSVVLQGLKVIGTNV